MWAFGDAGIEIGLGTGTDTGDGTGTGDDGADDGAGDDDRGLLCWGLLGLPDSSLAFDGEAASLLAAASGFTGALRPGLSAVHDRL